MYSDIASKRADIDRRRIELEEQRWSEEKELIREEMRARSKDVEQAGRRMSIASRPALSKPSSCEVSTVTADEFFKSSDAGPRSRKFIKECIMDAPPAEPALLIASERSTAYSWGSI
ncbi:hypothetical protein PsorP6_004630 [Peronosclerospora sorghi]|uniref:Uncharacterized protein n=1 Tax=Peronosclerospora sorghi TaxID=230839 RepID=A0ACC0VK10_9STRA|nr:hypothetical protein PsorP6_004630 [Peronosclerospora sorghi]